MKNFKEKYHLSSPCPSQTSSAVFQGAISCPPLMVLPHVGIATLRLGMSKKEIFEALVLLCNSREEEWQLSNDVLDDTWRYQRGAAFFMVRYVNDCAVEISVDRGLSEHTTVMWAYVDVFKTPVAQIVDTFKPYDTVTCDCHDEELATEYVFHNNSVRLWREQAFHEKLLLDASYCKQMSTVLEDMKQYLYLDMITVRE